MLARGVQSLGEPRWPHRATQAEDLSRGPTSQRLGAMGSQAEDLLERSPGVYEALGL